MRNPQINLLVIRTNQPKILAEFYELLGMKFCYHQHGNGPFHYAAEMDTFVFEIYPLLKKQHKTDSSLRLGFTVDYLDKLIVTLKAHNVDILKEPTQMEWGYVGVIKDLDGRKIELKEDIS